MKRWFKNKWARIKYKCTVEGWGWQYEAKGGNGETWRMVRVFGAGQETYGANAAYDCSGLQFCWGVDKYLFGLVTVGYYGIDC